MGNQAVSYQFYNTLKFGVFALDRHRGSLLRAGKTVALRPKSWEVLNYLAERAGVLVSTEALHDAVWPQTAVTPKTLTNVIAELRQVLQDDANKPRYIETVHRRGFRFIAAIEAEEPIAGGAVVAAPLPNKNQGLGLSDRDPLFIGRNLELQDLLGSWEDARAGCGRVVIITGEPGIGKTALVDQFVRVADLTAGSGHIGDASRGPAHATFVARGQCVERHGAHEAYMPLLEALAALASGSNESELATLLYRYAPSWLAQIPWLVSAQQRQALDLSLQGGSAARMLREGARLLEALAERRPLLLILEDLHWSDPETLDLIATIGQRIHKARILLIATYRPVEARIHAHPLMSIAPNLLRAGNKRVMLDPFSPDDISIYLSHCFPDSDVARRMTALVEDHSGGNPLLVRAMTDHLVTQGWVRSDGTSWELAADPDTFEKKLPDSVRDVIETQLDSLDAGSLALLEAAAVIGVDFAAESLAAVLPAQPQEIEATLRLLQGRWLSRRDDDSQRAIRRTHYAFVHSLYQRVLYKKIPELRRRDLHQQVGEHLEASAAVNGVPAAVLAGHFERSGDHVRAARHLEAAAYAVGRRAASREMAAYLSRAVEQVRQLADEPERAVNELRLQVALGEAATQAFGPDDDLVKAATARSVELLSCVDDAPVLFVALHGLSLYTMLKGDFAASRELVQKSVALAQRHPQPELQLLADVMSGTAACFEGRPPLARERLQIAAASLSRLSADCLPSTTVDIGVELGSNLAWASWLCGYPDQALQIAQAAVASAVTSHSPNSYAIALIYLFNVHHLRGEYGAARQCARDLQQLGEDHELVLSQRTGLTMEAAALMETGDTLTAMNLLQQSGASTDTAGLQQIVGTFFLGRVALMCDRMGNPVQGLMLIADALHRMQRSASPTSEAEILRIQGELAQHVDADTLTALGLRPDAGATPETVADRFFARAVDVAREQGAKAWELRATISRCRLWQRQKRSAQASRALTAIYDWFTEGFETQDLREARDLLAELDAQASSDGLGCDAAGPSAPAHA